MLFFIQSYLIYLVLQTLDVQLQLLLHPDVSPHLSLQFLNKFLILLWYLRLAHRTLAGHARYNESILHVPPSWFLHLDVIQLVFLAFGVLLDLLDVLLVRFEFIHLHVHEDLN